MSRPWRTDQSRTEKRRASGRYKKARYGYANEVGWVADEDLGMDRFVAVMRETRGSIRWREGDTMQRRGRRRGWNSMLETERSSEAHAVCLPSVGAGVDAGVGVGRERGYG